MIARVRGWGFEKLADGSVEVTRRKGGGDDPPIVLTETFTAEEWAQILSSTSNGKKR